MNSRHLKRLPVVDAGGGGFGGNLIGIVSRCDLLSVFLRPDEDIAREVREMLAQILLDAVKKVLAASGEGIVRLRLIADRLNLPRQGSSEARHRGKGSGTDLAAPPLPVFAPNGLPKSDTGGA